MPDKQFFRTTCKILRKSDKTFVRDMQAFVFAYTQEDAEKIGTEKIKGCLKNFETAQGFITTNTGMAEKFEKVDLGKGISTATWVCYYRRSRKLTLSQLATLSGVELRLLQKIENSETKSDNATARTVLSLAAALQVSPYLLLDYTPDFYFEE